MFATSIRPQAEEKPTSPFISLLFQFSPAKRRWDEISWDDMSNRVISSFRTEYPSAIVGHLSFNSYREDITRGKIYIPKSLVLVTLPRQSMREMVEAFSKRIDLCLKENVPLKPYQIQATAGYCLKHIRWETQFLLNPCYQKLYQLLEKNKADAIAKEMAALYEKELQKEKNSEKDEIILNLKTNSWKNCGDIYEMLADKANFANELGLFTEFILNIMLASPEFAKSFQKRKTNLIEQLTKNFGKAPLPEALIKIITEYTETTPVEVIAKKHRQQLHFFTDAPKDKRNPKSNRYTAIHVDTDEEKNITQGCRIS